MFIMMFYDHLISILLISCNVGFIMRLLLDPSMLTLFIGCIVTFTMMFVYLSMFTLFVILLPRAHELKKMLLKESSC